MKKNFENMKEFFNPKIILISMLPLLIVFFLTKNFMNLWEIFASVVF